MDYLESLQNCQNILYQGFTTIELSGISWLNNFCAELLIFCKQLHKFLIFDCKPDKHEEIIEISFLCLTQIMSCIKYLEKAIQMENAKNIVLTLSRQHFLDRIIWCFSRLKSCFNSAQDNVLDAEVVSFVTLMDSMLDMISPYNAYEKEDIENIAKYNAEAMFVSQKIRSTVDSLLSHTLAFANVVLETDKKALTALCQKVLRECIAFQEECSLNKKSSTVSAEHNRRFKAILFENSLFQLEDYINESLLRLVFKVMQSCSQHSLDGIRKLIETKSAEKNIDEAIADFDINIDRIIQIGIFAMAFAPDTKVKTTVRSCLASLESLDSNLIPSFYNAVNDSVILEEHYYEEIKKYELALHEIIDTIAICTCYREILNNCIKLYEKEFNKNSIDEILNMGNILKEHFIHNSNDLNLNNDLNKMQRYEEFCLMLDECQAINSCANQVESTRILKRLKILRSCVKKFQQCLDEKSKPNKTKSNQTFEIDSKTLLTSINSDEVENSKEISLESFGIKPSKTSILYKTRRDWIKTDSLNGNTSKLQRTSSSSSRSSNKIKRRVSLRIAMFKRQKSNESKTLWESYNNQSMSLHITDILDQITNLSSTLSNSS